MTDHIRHQCNCGRDNCNLCELFLCEICGGFEGALLPECPGRRLTEEEHEENYKHYCSGTGPFYNTPIARYVREHKK